MNNLKQIREIRKLKQNEMASLLNITREAYSSYETERNQMDYALLKKIAKIFDVTIDFILDSNDDDIILLTLGDYEKLMDAAKIILKLDRKISTVDRLKNKIEIHNNNIKDFTINNK